MGESSRPEWVDCSSRLEGNITIPAISVFFFLKLSKSLRNNGKKLGQIRRQIWLFCYILLLNDKRVIPKERNTVRVIKLIRAPVIIRAKLAMLNFSAL